MTDPVQQAERAALSPAAAGFLADVDRHMRALVDGRTGAVSTAALDPIEAGGKRIRPLLVRAARPRYLDGDAPAASVFDACSIRVAAAIELVHTASLVHDDVLDEARTRRGHETTWAQHGVGTATATGDLLFALAFETLVQVREAAGDAVARRCVRLLARTSRTLAHGEALQAAQVRDPWLAEDAYLHRCASKTGVLFGAALQLGAIVGGAELDDVDLLGRFGVEVGVAFQVADDILDCEPANRASQLGKQPGADLLDGTITLPMLLAVRGDESLADVLAMPVAPSDVDGVLARIRAVGAVEAARRHAEKLRDAANLILDDLHGRYDVGRLHAIADGAVRRTR